MPPVARSSCLSTVRSSTRRLSNHLYAGSALRESAEVRSRLLLLPSRRDVCSRSLRSIGLSQCSAPWPTPSRHPPERVASSRATAPSRLEWSCNTRSRRVSSKIRRTCGSSTTMRNSDLVERRLRDVPSRTPSIIESTKVTPVRSTTIVPAFVSTARSKASRRIGAVCRSASPRRQITATSFVTGNDSTWSRCDPGAAYGRCIVVSVPRYQRSETSAARSSRRSMTIVLPDSPV